ncbi:MAG TPA: tRNA lysidine(34) synthetase TilS [Clostridiaceae bacterium]|nr:tRNA lysidine(34) synthetase TilS [Clostridiaceae bacterium]
MIERVSNTIKKYNLIENGDKIVVGISGGPDSVCLLHILHRLIPEYGLKLYALHVNHMLRGEDADLDELFVKEFCKSLGVPLRIIARDINKISKSSGVSIEEAGRDIRYRAFEQYAADVGASKIAVAHNKNDLVETVLMNIIRGTGLEGLTGIDYMRGRIIRPLLDIDRKDIEEYCRQNNLSPRIDLSNLENKYTRNKVRLDLIPYITRMFDVDVVESVYRLAALLKDDNDLIEKLALETYTSCVASRQPDTVSLDIAQLKKNHVSLVKRVLRNAIKDVKGNIKGIESKHIDMLIDLMESGRTGIEIHLPGRIRAAKSYGILRIGLDAKKIKTPLFEAEINVPGITMVPVLNASIEASVVEKKLISIEQYNNLRYNSLVQFFDYDKLNTGIYVRNRRNGDIFKPLKSNGTKKLKEYFIDNKIPCEKRDEIPLVAKENEIVWVIGYKISDKFKVTENTKSVLILKYTGNNGSTV